MNISRWFITPEELCLVENPYLLHLTADLMNDIETDEKNNYWKYRPFEHVREILSHKYRITLETFVILHTDEELMMAARFAWLLYWIGCKHIRILIGKIDPTSLTDPPCGVATLPSAPLRPRVRMTCDELLAGFEGSTTELIDVRTYTEYCGETTGYTYVRRAGRIPNFQYDPLDGIYERIKGDITWSELEDYLQMMSKANTPAKTTKRLVYMCGTGWRASLAAIFASQ